jgi:dipeptide/tripeptide permease
MFNEIFSIYLLRLSGSLVIKSKKIFSDSVNYFSVGFFFVFFGFMIMTLGLYYSTNLSKISPIIILSYLVCLTFSELFISAVGDSFIGELVQESLRGLMTGVARVNICIGVLLASTIANTFVLPYINRSGLTMQDSLKLEQFFFVASCSFLLLAFVVPLVLRNKHVFEEKHKVTNTYNKGKISEEIL